MYHEIVKTRRQRGLRVLQDSTYASAERFITEALVQAQKAQKPVMPHEVVEKLQNKASEPTWVAPLFGR